MKRLILFALALLVLGGWYRVSFSRYYAPVRATFVNFQSKDHKRFEYLYVVSGTTYTGVAFLGPRSNPVVYQAGSQLMAYYDVNHPANATVNPAILRSNKSIWLLAIPGTLVLLAIIFWPERRRPVQK